jgi:hypothetical protein
MLTSGILVAFQIVTTLPQSEKEILWKNEFQKICTILDAHYSPHNREMLAKDPAYWMNIEISNYIANRIVLTKDGEIIIGLFHGEGVKDDESVVTLIRIAYTERCKGNKIEFKKLISIKLKPIHTKKERIKIE